MSNRKDMLWVDSYGLALENHPSGRIITFGTEHYREIFEWLGRHTDKDYILVSSSDFSINYQHENHPNLDCARRYYNIDFASFQQDAPRDEYVYLTLGPCCDLEHCNPKDRYVVKVHSFSIGTFNSLPPNVKHWFSVGCNINEPWASVIPLGILFDEFSAGLMLDQMLKSEETPKDYLLYVNFNEFNAMPDRKIIKDHFRGKSWAKVIDTPSLSLTDYYSDVARSKFMIQPSGNGWDRFATIEALNLNTIPLLPYNNFSANLAGEGLPVMLAPSLVNVTAEDLEKAYEVNEFASFRAENFAPLRFSYWYNKILSKLND